MYAEVNMYKAFRVLQLANFSNLAQCKKTSGTKKVNSTAHKKRQNKK